MASSVVSAIASTKPLPSVLVEMRKVRISSSKATRFTMSGWVARDWMSDPPRDSAKPSTVELSGTMSRQPGSRLPSPRSDGTRGNSAHCRLGQGHPRSSSTSSKMNRLSLKERSGYDRVLIDLLERCTLRVEAVGHVVKSGRCLGNAGSRWNRFVRTFRKSAAGPSGMPILGT